jgi:hypothetical protein
MVRKIAAAHHAFTVIDENFDAGAIAQNAQMANLTPPVAGQYFTVLQAGAFQA